MAKLPAPTATFDDVNLLLHLYEMRREEKLRQAREWYSANVAFETLEDMQKLCPPGTPENAQLRMVVSYWDMVASFITSGVLNRELFFQNTRELLLTYIRIEKALPALREAYKDPLAFSNLETVATEFKAWMNKRAPGSYDAFAQRVGKPAKPASN